MQLRRKRHGVTELNITPLIDVVFILLVFFMLATSFARYRLISIEAPEETRVVRDAEAAIVVLLQADGSLLYDGDPLDPEDLAGAVARIIALDPARSFLIRPEDGVPLQRAIDVYGTVRAAGGQAVSFSPPRRVGGAP